MQLIRPSRPRQRGLGLVELMVGITVGLIVAAAASLIAVNQINEHRRLMLETQIQQDLRTASDLIQQDFRRAGFRGNAENGVWAPPPVTDGIAKPATPNLYAPFTVSSTTDGRTVSYAYARRDAATNAYNVQPTPTGNEQFGVKWDRSAETLYVQLGLKADGQPNWQPITDPEVLLIKDFTVDVDTTSLSLGGFCDKACGGTGQPVCPVQKIRKVSFTIVGVARHDANVRRTLSGVERIRADDISGTCPP
ncbi:MAG: prepilin-type N-terminal cleavage/methylation domain-containing protein [Roseateles sp.]|uniref:PilW family protein n=1 Tax=Roseateles sp. TaxID=1971397 RepID=UPI0039E76D8B